MLNRLKQMLIKELIQLFRDPRARFGLFVPSILQVLIYGYAANFELHHVRMAVLDLDHSYESRELLSRGWQAHHRARKEEANGSHRQACVLVVDGGVLARQDVRHRHIVRLRPSAVNARATT